MQKYEGIEEDFVFEETERKCNDNLCGARIASSAFLNVQIDISFIIYSIFHIVLCHENGI